MIFNHISTTCTEIPKKLKCDEGNKPFSKYTGRTHKPIKFL